VLEADIQNPKVSPAAASTLRVSIEQFADIAKNGVFGVRDSRLEWLDQDTSTTTFRWVEHPETVVHSTEYRS
jgi:hypothetical protein